MAPKNKCFLKTSIFNKKQIFGTRVFGRHCYITLIYLKIDDGGMELKIPAQISNDTLVKKNTKSITFPIQPIK